MGDRSSKRSRCSKKRKNRKRHSEDEDDDNSSPSPSPSSPYASSSSSGSEDAVASKHRRRSRSRRNRRRDEEEDDDDVAGRSSRREKERRRERESRRREKRDRERKHRRRSRREERARVSESDDGSGSSGDGGSGDDRSGNGPEAVVRGILEEFPSVAGDLQQLLQMIDSGKAVDIREISQRSLVKHLKKLFLSLELKETGKKVFIRPSNVQPTLDVVGPVICSHIKPEDAQPGDSMAANRIQSTQSDVTGIATENKNCKDPCPGINAPAPRRRMLGPEMPSADLLAAAAKLTEAEAELRDADVEEETELFIGPPPPALVAEAESANEAERFEEVTRLMDSDVNSPYDVLGVNRNTLSDSIKKRYWKLSLLVHPDKCSHPQAHQAFVILNKAFKELQDPDKRKELDEKIKLKEEQEEFKAELKAMREAAQWRRSQGISIDGDDELLAEVDVKPIPKRDEWMTTLPPERKPGMTMQSTKFSSSTKEGRGDTSAWTDTPSDRAQKAKMNYLEAYNETAALASNDEEKKRTRLDADLVDEYNKTKRSKSLVQKHQEAASRPKRKSKQKSPEKAEWEGNHPWKPWDREKDLTAGRKSVKLDSDSMAQGLTSRFSTGTFQRNFL